MLLRKNMLKNNLISLGIEFSLSVMFLVSKYMFPIDTELLQITVICLQNLYWKVRFCIYSIYTTE